MARTTRTTVSELLPGDILIIAGTTTHAAITVTETRPVGRYVAVYGFNARNPEPRLMFRSLIATLPVTIANR